MLAVRVLSLALTLTREPLPPQHVPTEDPARELAAEGARFDFALRGERRAAAGADFAWMREPPSLEVLAQFPHLETLALAGGSATDDALALLAHCPDLRGLRIRDATDLGAAGFSHIASLMKLVKLDLAGCPVTDEVAAALGRLPHLQVLDLSRSRLTDAGLEALAGLERLRILQLNDTAVAGAGLPALQPLRRLERLELARCRLDGAGFETLAALPRLEFLDLAGNATLGDDAIGALATCPRLRQLQASDTGAGGAGAARLAACGLLEFLGLAGTRVDDETLAALAPLDRLSGVDVDRSEVTYAGLERFARAHPSLHRLAVPSHWVAAEQARFRAAFPVLTAMHCPGGLRYVPWFEQLRRADYD